jgi:predicted acylesterase/phospholipase RssA
MEAHVGKKALVLGGGAPDYTLMTGALLAFEEAGVKFDVYSMAGGGGVVGLSYLAPLNMTREESLRNSVNFGVSDAIYNMFPINYKIFTKPGPAASLYRTALSMIPGYSRIVNQLGMTPSEKFLSDYVQFWWAALMPSNLSLFSEGFCAHAQFIKQMVDFDALHKLDADIYLNAYCLTDNKMAIFKKDQIDLAHFQASLSYPFFYSPYELNGKLYIEGASRDAFNFKGLMENEPDLDTIVVFDAIGIDGLLHEPRNLWDAFGQQIITPLVALGHADLKLFRELHHDKDKSDLLVLNFKIPPKLQPAALDWSSSNLNRLFAVGYESGQAFLEKNGSKLGV